MVWKYCLRKELTLMNGIGVRVSTRGPPKSQGNKRLFFVSWVIVAISSQWCRISVNSITRVSAPETNAQGGHMENCSKFRISIQQKNGLNPTKKIATLSHKKSATIFKSYIFQRTSYRRRSVCHASVFWSDKPLPAGSEPHRSIHGFFCSDDSRHRLMIDKWATKDNVEVRGVHI